MIVVPGVGPLDPLGIIVGEAPGAEEAKRGEPFVGQSGTLLTETLQLAGGRRQDFYITNVCKEYREGNPTPSEKEIDAVRSDLRAEILERGDVPILLLGNVALYAALKEHGITRHRGLWRKRCLPTWHPAAVLYDATKHETFIQDVKEFVRVCWTVEAGSVIPGGMSVPA